MPLTGCYLMVKNGIEKYFTGPVLCDILSLEKIQNIQYQPKEALFKSLNFF